MTILIERGTIWAEAILTPRAKSSRFVESEILKIIQSCKFFRSLNAVYRIETVFFFICLKNPEKIKAKSALTASID